MLLRQKAKIGNFVFGNWAKPVENFLFLGGGRRFFSCFFGKSRNFSLFLVIFFWCETGLIQLNIRTATRWSPRIFIVFLFWRKLKMPQLISQHLRVWSLVEQCCCEGLLHYCSNGKSYRIMNRNERYQPKA